MKSNKKAILRMLEKQGDSLSVKQIRGSLGLKKAATAKLKAELLKLIKAGKIVKHGTRYQKSQEIINNFKTNRSSEIAISVIESCL